MSIKHIVAFGDTHYGSTLALYSALKRDDGGQYQPSPLQSKLELLWDDFWNWAASVTGKDRFAVVHVGDIIDGNHHKITSLVSHNLLEQERMAVAHLKPRLKRAARYYQIRGTEAHAGVSCEHEERIGEKLKACQVVEGGNYTHWELKLRLRGKLIHFAHHIGVTSSSSYESSALMREVTAAFTEAGQWREEPPALIVRAHRHRFMEVNAPGSRIVVLPGWQAKTPHVFKMDRMRAPQFGGIVITVDDNGELSVKNRVYTVRTSEEVTL